MKKACFLLTTMLFLVASMLLNTSQAGAQAKKRIVHYERTSTEEDKINLKIVRDFMAQNPSVDVKFLLFEDADRAVKIRNALASGGEIDTCSLTNGESPEFLSTGQMLEIIPKSFGKKSVQEVVDMWKPGAFNTTGGVWQGKYYGIPHQLANYAAWINVKFMKEAGLNPDTDIPKTWDDFVTIAKKLTVDKGGVRVRNGFATNSKTSIFQFLILTALAAQQGCSWATEETFLASLENPNLANAFRTFTDFATTDKIWDPGLFDNEREGFANGLTATFLTGGSWYWGVIDGWKVPRTDVRPFPYPRYAGGKDIGGIGYGYSVYVTKLAKDPELAFRWLDFMAGHVNDFIKIGYYQPKKTLDEELAAKSIPYYKEVFKAELAKTATWISSTKSAEITDAVGATASRILFENMPVDESIKQLKTDVAAILKK